MIARSPVSDRRLGAALLFLGNFSSTTFGVVAPEPSSLAAIGAGALSLAGVMIARRRRQGSPQS